MIEIKIYYDNIIYNLQKAGGVSIYWYEMMKRLIRDKKNIKFIETNKNNNIFSCKLEQYETITEIKCPVKFSRYMPLLKKIEQDAIFHSSYYRVSLQKKIINITTVHDFTYEYFSNGMKKWINYYQKKMAIYFSKGIICISENTKKDLLKFHPWAKDKKIRIIYNGVSDEFYRLNRAELDDVYEKYGNEKYVLFVGDRAEYKNFDMVVDALKDLTGYYLLIIGGKQLSKKELELLERKLMNRYKRLEGISTEELNKLYNIAFCLVYPSEYEGFGIPPLEAMKAGCPVIVNNASSIPEVVGDAGLKIDIINSLKIKENIELLNKKELRESLINKGINQVKKFDWENTYNEILDFYEEVYKSELGVRK